MLSMYSFLGSHAICSRYHLDLRRAQLLQIIDRFRNIIVRHEHEDPALTMYFEGVRRI